MFLVALGVPLSWEKLSLGTSMRWLGWGFNWADRVAWVPDDKRAKLLAFLVQLREPRLSAGCWKIALVCLCGFVAESIGLNLGCNPFIISCSNLAVSSARCRVRSLL